MNLKYASDDIDDDNNVGDDVDDEGDKENLFSVWILFLILRGNSFVF